MANPRRASEDRGQPKTTRTLMRGLAVLETLSDAGRGLGPTEVAAMVELDKGTVSRLLQTLCEAGYVRRETTTRTYVLSTKILQLSQGLRQHLDLRSIAHPHLAKLCAEVQETVHLGVRDEGQVVYVHKVEPQNQAIRMVSAIGRTMPLATTALGKAMLAGYPQSVLEDLLPRVEFGDGTDRAIKDLSTLQQQLEEIRLRGFAIDDRENEEEIICVGAAVVGDNDVVIGAISVTSPSFRVADHIDEVGMLCRAAAEGISEDASAARLGT